MFWSMLDPFEIGWGMITYVQYVNRSGLQYKASVSKSEI